jgi:hypothetical protein
LSKVFSQTLQDVLPQNLQFIAFRSWKSPQNFQFVDGHYHLLQKATQLVINKDNTFDLDFYDPLSSNNLQSTFFWSSTRYKLEDYKSAYTKHKNRLQNQLFVSAETLTLAHLPATITHLTLPGRFNQPIDDLPPALTHLRYSLSISASPASSLLSYYTSNASIE